MPDQLLSRQRVLICEDEHLQAISLTKAMKLLGAAEVEAVSTGEAAVEAARSTRPNLALIDINLPGIDGIDVLRQIKTAGTRVVMITVYTDENVIRDAFNAGADAYLTKPILFDDVQAVVRELGPFQRAPRTRSRQRPHPECR